MKLINQTKTKFVTSKGEFAINKIMDFKKEEAKTLLRYEGINAVDDIAKVDNESLNEE